MYMPIKALNTFTRDWKIQARVLQKCEKRMTKSGGSLLKITLIDMYETKIEGTFFDDAADAFEKKLVEGNVYIFSGGTVKMANKKFTSLKNDFCIVFEKTALITDQDDDGSIAPLDRAFEFSTIKSIEDMNAGTQRSLDILGLIIDVTEPETVKLKSNREKVRKYVTLVDETSCSIVVTLWGDICEKNTLTPGDIIALTGARVSDYGGKSLNSASDHAELQVNPNHERARKLSMWYNELIMKHGQNAINMIKSLTSRMRGGEPLPESKGGMDTTPRTGQRKNNLSLICEVAEQLKDANDVDAGHIFFINGFLCHIKNDIDKLVYPACPNDSCKRKVFEDSQGNFRCESCNKAYPNCTPTYMIIGKIADSTDSVFVNFAREHGTSIMGMNAKEFKEMRDSCDEEGLSQFFDQLLFKQYNIMIKGKYEFYQGENRMRYFAVKVLPHSTGAENKAMLKRLDMYKLMQSIQPNYYHR